MLNKYLLTLLLGITIPCVAMASSASKAQKSLDPNLVSYQLAIRWSDFEAAISSLDPTIERDEDFSERTEAYYKGFQIVSYNLKSASWPQEMVYQQRVEIGFIALDTQVEQKIIDKQIWRYDAVAKRWWLTTGLPKLD